MLEELIHKSSPSLRNGTAFLVALMTLLSFGPARAQDRPKIEIVPTLGHSERVTSVAFSPDGRRVLSGSADKTIKLWDTATGSLIRTFEGHSSQVNSVAFSPDGTRVLAGGLGKTFELWDAATGALIRTFEGHQSWVNSVAFSPDGTRVLAGGGGKTFELWDAATGALIRTFEGHSDWVPSVAFSPDGDRMLSASSDVELWDAATGALIRTFEGHSGPVHSVTFSPDGSRVLSGSADKTIKLWDAATGALIRTFDWHSDEGHSGGVTSVAFSPDGGRVLSDGGGKTIKLWDAATGALIRTFEGHSAGVTSVTFSPDGSRVLSGGDDKTIKLWDAATGALIRTFEGHSDWVHPVAFSPDGTRVLSGSADKTIKLWDAATGGLIRTFEGHSAGVTSVAFSPGGDRMLSASSDVKLWDAATGALIRTFQGYVSVAFSPDGGRVLSGSLDGMKLWDAATGALIRTFEGHQSWVNSVAFSPDGTRVLSASADKTIKLWDAATGALSRNFEGHSDGVTSVAFSPDGTRVLAGGGGKTFELWDAATGALIRTFEGHSGWVDPVAFSPDGGRVLSGSEDETIKLWDAATGALIRTFEGHSGPVHSVTFSPDRSRVLSGGGDGTVRIWKLATGKHLVSLIGGRDGEWLAITPEGFFTASRNSTELLSIVRGLNVTAVDQVWQSLFNPDLVREALAGDPDGEVREAAKVINLEKVLESGPAPAVAITSHPRVSESSLDLITVKAQITDRGKGIGRIEWRVNGITAAVGLKPEGIRGPGYPVTQKLALDPGDNTIEVTTYNERNILASLPARTTIKFIGPANQAKPRLYILAIGINKYVDKGGNYGRFPPLKGSVPDAKAFSVEMEKAGGGQYQKVSVTLSLDEDATLSKLDEAVAKIASEITPRDTFVLYAAAHGYSLGGNYYMIPQDYQGGGNPEALRARAISQERVQEWLASRIKAKRAVILLDTCESGALTGGYAKSRTEGPVSEAAVGRLHEATGRPVITAASPGKSAYENYKGHGVFTYALIEALHKGDTNNNGKIEVTELAAHVERRVPELFAELKQNGWVVKGLAAARGGGGDAQTAHFGSTGGDFALVNKLP
jgi:WD40 repeat protein